MATENSNQPAQKPCEDSRRSERLNSIKVLKGIRANEDNLPHSEVAGCVLPFVNEWATMSVGQASDLPGLFDEFLKSNARNMPGLIACINGFHLP